MTRFALWVEDGQLVAPLSVMRFDDSIYEILGSKFVGLTGKQRLSMKKISWFAEYFVMQAPGALVDGLAFTL